MVVLTGCAPEEGSIIGPAPPTLLTWLKAAEQKMPQFMAMVGQEKCSEMGTWEGESILLI
jgi:hypothetical protein